MSLSRRDLEQRLKAGPSSLKMGLCSPPFVSEGCTYPMSSTLTRALKVLRPRTTLIVTQQRRRTKFRGFASFVRRHSRLLSSFHHYLTRICILRSLYYCVILLRQANIAIPASQSTKLLLQLQIRNGGFR